MIFFSKKKKSSGGTVPDDSVYTQSSICTGETIIGFKNSRGELELAQVVRSWDDVEAFYLKYNLKMSDTTKDRVILRSFKNGFTLVELICVLSIITILASICIPAFTGYISRSKANQCVVNCNILSNALAAQLNSERAMGTYGVSGTLSEVFKASLSSTNKSSGASVADASAAEFVFCSVAYADNLTGDYSESDDVVSWIIEHKHIDELTCPVNGHHYYYDSTRDVFTCGEHESSVSGGADIDLAASNSEFTITIGEGTAPEETEAPEITVTAVPVEETEEPITVDLPELNELTVPNLSDGDIQISHYYSCSWVSGYYPLGHNAIGFMVDEAPATITDLAAQLEITIPIRNKDTGDYSSNWCDEFVCDSSSGDHSFFSCSDYNPAVAGIYAVNVSVPAYDYNDWYYCEGEAVLYVYIYDYQSLTYTSSDGVNIVFNRIFPWEYFQLAYDNTYIGYEMPKSCISEYEDSYYIFPQEISLDAYSATGSGVEFDDVTPESQSCVQSDSAGLLNTSRLYDYTCIDKTSYVWSSDVYYLWNRAVPKWAVVYINTSYPSETTGRVVDIALKKCSKNSNFSYSNSNWLKDNVPEYKIQ